MRPGPGCGAGGGSLPDSGWGGQVSRCRPMRPRPCVIAGFAAGCCKRVMPASLQWCRRTRDVPQDVPPTWSSPPRRPAWGGTLTQTVACWYNSCRSQEVPVGAEDTENRLHPDRDDTSDPGTPDRRARIRDRTACTHREIQARPPLCHCQPDPVVNRRSDHVRLTGSGLPDVEDARVSSIDFSSAFRALTGHYPFPWQRRLFDMLRDSRLPAAVDIPTGLGKTAIMAIWVLARAAGARLPRRLVYVVDRRAVVDQATDFAEELRDVLAGRRSNRFDETCNLPAGTFLSPRFAGSTWTTESGWRIRRRRRSSSAPSTWSAPACCSKDTVSRGACVHIRRV